jgi:hypothetical protein
MRSFNGNVRHIFTHEDFDGMALEGSKPTLIDAKQLIPTVNFHRYQMYTSSLHKFFPQHFPNLASRLPKKEMVDKCQELLDGLKVAEVTYFYRVYQGS